MASNFSRAHAWKGTGSSLIGASGSTLQALARPVGPGNQTPEKSILPSVSRGGGPPGGSGTGLTLPRASTNGLSCAATATVSSAAAPTARQMDLVTLSPDLGAEDPFDILAEALDGAVGELDERGRVPVLLAVA